MGENIVHFSNVLYIHVSLKIYSLAIPFPPEKLKSQAPPNC